MRSKNQTREIPHINSFVRFAEVKHTTIPPTQLVRMSQSRNATRQEAVDYIAQRVHQARPYRATQAGVFGTSRQQERNKYASYLSSETRALVWTTAVRRGLEANLGGCHVAMLLPGEQMFRLNSPANCYSTNYSLLANLEFRSFDLAHHFCLLLSLLSSRHVSSQILLRAV